MCTTHKLLINLGGAVIAISACQNAENEHCETLEKHVHKLNFSSYDMLIQVI